MRISKKMAVALVMGLFTANTFAGVGIQAEVGGTQISDLLSVISSNGAEPVGTKIGIRVSGSNSPVAFDFLTGFGFSTEINDSASGLTNPRSLFFNATVGLSMKIHNGDKSALSILPRYSMTFASNSVDTGSFQASKFVYYSSVFNTLSVALEPSVKLSDNVELFTNFGIALKFIPASKHFDSSNKLTAAKDGATSIGFTGILLGFRYNL